MYYLVHFQRINHIVTDNDPVCKHNRWIDYTYLLYIKHTKLVWSSVLKLTWDVDLNLNSAQTYDHCKTMIKFLFESLKPDIYYFTDIFLFKMKINDDYCSLLLQMSHFNLKNLIHAYAERVFFYFNTHWITNQKTAALDRGLILTQWIQ